MKYPRYPKYQDSGVAWLGEVPEGWEVKYIKRLSPVQRGASPRPIEDPKYFDDDGEFAWVRIADVSSSSGFLRETTQRLSPLGSSLSVKIKPGDLFVSIAGSVGKPCIAGIKACIHDGFVYFPLLTNEQKFLFYIFDASFCYGGLGKFGTQLNLNTNTVGAISIACPPQNEQQTIITFLDHNCAKIDALIAEQEKLIALLREKRQTVISHAVTKGLNPAAPMKDSGVEWLGKVPSRWEMVPLKKSVTYLEGPGILANDFCVDGIPLIRISGVKDEFVTLDGANFLNPDIVENKWAHFKLQYGDYLISGSASTGLCSKVNNISVGSIPYTGLIIVRPKESIASDYIPIFFSSRMFFEQITILQAGSTIQHFGPSHLAKMFIVLPPENEQFAIIQFVRDQTAKIDTLIAESKQAVVLLKERRSALISAAVTGKIDVRNICPNKGLHSMRTEL